MYNYDDKYGQADPGELRTVLIDTWYSKCGSPGCCLNAISGADGIEYILSTRLSSCWAFNLGIDEESVVVIQATKQNTKVRTTLGDWIPVRVWRIV